MSVVFSLSLTFVGGVLASLSFIRAVWPGKEPDLRWATLALFLAFASGYGLYLLWA